MHLQANKLGSSLAGGRCPGLARYGAAGFVPLFSVFALNKRPFGRILHEGSCNIRINTPAEFVMTPPGLYTPRGMNTSGSKERFARRGFRSLLMLLGVLFVAQIGLAFTPWLSPLHRWLAAPEYAVERTPAWVVVLGGGGIPSESGLIRTYYAAQIGTNLPHATFIVSLPADDDPERSSVGKMRDELVLRGIPAAAVRMEHRGRNTHEQARYIREMLPESARDEPVLLVTSPSHFRRSVLCFRREGFREIGSLAARGVGVEADLGGGVPFRYVFWSRLAAQVDAVRELCALCYYRLRGWI
jgi:uncharacterized SAM-binding protein YcdF (DUF218 family)